MNKTNGVKSAGRSMPLITTTGELVIEDAGEIVMETSVEENESWSNVEEQNVEPTNEANIKIRQDLHSEPVESDEEQIVDNNVSTEFDIVDEENPENTNENLIQEEDLNFFEESDEESEDEAGPAVEVKDSNVLVNLAGRKMNEEDMKYAAEMKAKMKEFFQNCSPDIAFSSLLHLFVQKIPQPKPIYVLSHDQRPRDPVPLHKYAILCSVKDCENAYFRDGGDWESIEQKKNFFGFPPNPDKCKEWIESLGRTKYLNKNINEMQMYRVCEDHFKPEDFTNEYREELSESAVPSLFLGGTDLNIEFD